MHRLQRRGAPQRQPALPEAQRGSGAHLRGMWQRGPREGRRVRDAVSAVVQGQRAGAAGDRGGREAAVRSTMYS